MSSQPDFFPEPMDEIEPLPVFPFDNKDEEPEEEDYKCSVCSLLMSNHKTSDIVECALKELRGEKN